MYLFIFQTNCEITELERTMAILRKAIDDKVPPLRVAMTRLKVRTKRVDVELCKDPVMNGYDLL